MLRDGASILPLCIIPYYGDGDQIKDNGEFAHKAPVLLDCFYEEYKFDWDLTTKRVRNFFEKSWWVKCFFGSLGIEGQGSLG
jgi:hypothetical protein